MNKQAGTFEAMLRRAGLRLTPARLAVLEVLSGGRDSMDVTQVHAKLSFHTDVVTVYRTLNTLVKKGLAHRVRGPERSRRYAAGDPLDASRHQHPHFVCATCGKVECLDRVAVPADLVRTLRLGRGYTVSYAEVILHGVCPGCRS